MKKLSIFLLLSLISVFAFAEALPEAPAYADTVVKVLDFLAGLPYVGVAVVFVIKWLGLLTALCTIISTVLKVINASLKIVSKPESAGINTAIYWVAKIDSYIAYISAYNVQKAVQKQ